MNSQKHTPGPWEIRLDVEGIPLAVAREGYMPLASLGDPRETTTTAENEANARLIAAAPDLLAALQWAQARIFKYEGNSDVYEAADAAITKARGGR